MASIENSEGGMPKQSGIADLIVKGAIALITAACFVGAYLQFQMSFWVALIGALSVYCVLVMGHALMRRSEREKDLVYEVNRLEDEVARLKVAAPADGPTMGRGAKITKAGAAGAAPLPPVAGKAPAAAAPPSIAPPPVSPAHVPAAPAPQAAAPAAPGAKPPVFVRGGGAPSLDISGREPRLRAPQPAAEPPMTARPEPALPEAPAVGLGLRAEPAHADIPPMPSLPDWSAPPAASAAGERKMHDYWPAQQAKPALPEAPHAEPSLAAERETDLDAVHGMIKRLADEVAVADAPALEGLPQRQESVLRASLNALQTTASAMRGTKKKGDLPLKAGVPRASDPMPPPIMPSHARMSALADAIAAGRIEITLSPIVGLADHQVHYYEVIACPRDERGVHLSTTTRDPQLAIAGLLPLFDSMRLRQAAGAARSLAGEGRQTSLFSAATAVSLANDGFLDALADAYRDREALAGELVLNFAQADVRTFGGSEWSALTDMRDLGFRFCVEDVSDFDYEFTALSAAGFAFVKLDAATLLAGLSGPSGRMPAEEVCRSLSELGLSLIVGNIVDEATRDKVLAAGAPLGQGLLFGAPTAMGDNAFAAAGDAAA